MEFKFYNPFDKLEFEEDICFLTGAKTNQKLTVFPKRLMEHYEFENEMFSMMDRERKLLYKDLTIPASPEAIQVFDELDSIIEEAFEEGFEAVKSLDSLQLFQWIGRIIYGILYHELVLERSDMKNSKKEFGLSDILKERYGIFHLMLQSVIKPIQFEGVSPWTILVLGHRQSEEAFSYRDDSVNLLFSMRVMGFGIIACLQDNEAIYEKEKDLVNQIGNAELHPLQFEELYARFHYSDYIKLYKPEYQFAVEEDALIIESMPVVPEEGYPLFGLWDEDMFSQVLTNYWELYGIQKEEIFRFPDPLKSFLVNPYSLEFIDPVMILIPY